MTQEVTYELAYVIFFIYQGFCKFSMNFDIANDNIFLKDNKYCKFKKQGKNYCQFQCVLCAGIMAPLQLTVRLVKVSVLKK
jgi:hypothetical protein